LALTCASDTARTAFDSAIAGYLAFRSDAADAVGRLIAADPECAMGYVLRGEMAMMANDHRLIANARADAQSAVRLAASATPREQAHAAALENWAAGDIDRTLAIWAEIARQEPRDILAFRIHHSTCFWLGQRAQMMELADHVRPHWDAAMPAYGAVLACRAFAHEECASHEIAEAEGRKAVALDPANPWAAHAVAHVLEMQGRADEGIDWLAGLSGHWGGCNNFVHHLWWHMALYHLEKRQYDEVLTLYDQRFRDLAAPLTVAAPDLYIDMQNAISMLFRLERQGVDVGGRWAELADKAAARIGDSTSAFTGRLADAENMLDAMVAFVAAGEGAVEMVIAESTIPVGRAMIAAATGDYKSALTHMRPALPLMQAMGGSRAQQAFLDEVFLDIAEKAESTADCDLILEKASQSHIVPPHGRVGFHNAAARAA
ncbi:MAG: tetratricopeptide repeat protein, partial [Alphaproteobacteria bacterium]